MIVRVLSPPYNTVSVDNVCEEYEKLFHKIRVEDNEYSDYYAIEPYDWNDPYDLGINILIPDAAFLDEEDDEDYTEFTIISPDEMYTKLYNTYNRILKAMEYSHVEIPIEVHVLFPLPTACNNEREKSMYAIMHGVLSEQFNVYSQIPLISSNSVTGIIYLVKK